MEKKTIIKEIFEETYERLDDSVDMKIETLNPKDKIPVNCPKCNTPLNKIYCRYEDSEIDEDDDVFDLKVFKCPECKKVYAYWIDNSFRNSRFDVETENSEPTGNQPLENKRTPAVPKKCAQEYSKAISALETKNKEMDRLIQEKLPELNKAGLSLETINYARNKVASYLKTKKVPSKSLNKVVAAAFYVTGNSVTTDGGSLWKHQGEGISERQLEEIFGVTRKTIRKWSRHFL